MTMHHYFSHVVCLGLCSLTVVIVGSWIVALSSTTELTAASPGSVSTDSTCQSIPNDDAEKPKPTQLTRLLFQKLKFQIWFVMATRRTQNYKQDGVCTYVLTIYAKLDINIQ